MAGKFCTTYDIDEGLVTFYQSYIAFKASKVLGKIYLKMCFKPFIDILLKDFKSLIRQDRIL